MDSLFRPKDISIAHQEKSPKKLMKPLSVLISSICFKKQAPWRSALLPNATTIYSKQGTFSIVLPSARAGVVHCVPPK